MSYGWREEEEECRVRAQHPAAARVVEAEGEHERYRWKREGLRYTVRAGTGTRVLFRTWTERAAMILCTELLCAYNDGYFVRQKRSQSDRGGVE